MGRTEEKNTATELTPEALVASQQVDAWLLCLPENEKDPGLAFMKIDWRLRGAVTRAVTLGALTRESGEVSLLPVTRMISDLGSQTFRVITLGVKNRESVSAAELSSLIKNIQGLHLKSVGLSASDFGWKKSETAKHFNGMKGVELCVTE